MKIKIKNKRYEEVLALPKAKRPKPMKQHMLFRIILRFISSFDLWATHFKWKKIGMEKLGKDEPCFVLMNHSSFIDLEIVSTVMFPKRFGIVTTSDAFVGLNWILRLIGCVPTKKFIADTNLIRDMVYMVKELKSSVVMFPEASYSFDGTATPLPDSIGRCAKLLSVPIVMIRTYGAFTRDPLYNGLRRRKVDVSADMKYLLSTEEVAAMSADEITEIVRAEFSFDNFRWQQENRVTVTEPFRAEGLNRVLYKCPDCFAEGHMVSEGTKIRCGNCGKQYELTECGFLEAENGEGKFSHIPDWYQWERDCVRKEIESGQYHLDVEVDICMMVDTKSIYRVGEGRLEHSKEGFHLTGCDGQLDYYHKPLSSYSLYSDYYWYETGDVICIGDTKVLYYCFPKKCGDIVAKTRLATEEIYKLVKQNKKAN